LPADPHDTDSGSAKEPTLRSARPGTACALPQVTPAPAWLIIADVTLDEWLLAPGVALAAVMPMTRPQHATAAVATLNIKAERLTYCSLIHCC
jgi:hypothetical protein